MSNPFRRTSNEVKTVELTGCFMPMYEHNSQPVLLLPHGEGDFYLLPVFSTVEKLKAAMATWIHPRHPWKIVRIDDGIDFLSSIPTDSIQIGIDPRVEDGKTKFMGIIGVENG